jgi:hypothetical protein
MRIHEIAPFGQAHDVGVVLVGLLNHHGVAGSPRRARSGRGVGHGCCLRCASCASRTALRTSRS